MFTDLEIELSTIVYSRNTDNTVIKQKMLLRTVIIFFFIAGGISGAYLFSGLKYKSFFIPVGILVVAMFYDIFRVNPVKIARKIKRNVIISNPGTA